MNDCTKAGYVLLIQPLRPRGDRAEHQGALARAGDAREDRQLPLGDGHVDAAEVVDPALRGPGGSRLMRLHWDSLARRSDSGWGQAYRVNTSARDVAVVVGAALQPVWCSSALRT